MERSRRRKLSISLAGRDAPGEDEMELDDGDADVIELVCEECGYTETAEDRGDDGDEEE